MALEGHGIAFLPYSAVKKDLRARKLVSAMPTPMKELQITMEVRAYRERPVGKDAQRNGSKPPQLSKSAAQALWNYLATGAAPDSLNE
jgi:DNA-binding transcriptional LysR family regulator